VSTVSPRPVVKTLASRLTALGTTGTRVLVAVSGGIDSVALFRAACEIRAELQLELLVGHYNHRFRGAIADADADWVAKLAERWQIPAIIGVADREPACTDEPLPEESARQERYAFLRQVAVLHGCNAVLTAHTADDQVETVLHHLFRGTGLAGLRGIPAERSLSPGVRLLRPLLDVPRAELEQYLHSLGQDFRTDATNRNVGMTRNWLRHTALPMLRERFPQVDHAVGRLAQQAADIESMTAALADRLLEDACCDNGPDVVRLRAADLANQPRHLVREVFVRLWESRGWPKQSMTYDRWNELAELVTETDQVLMLPGAIEARRRGELLVLTQK
jgi:tRNA(Ile)-lysidine synthase